MGRISTSFRTASFAALAVGVASAATPPTWAQTVTSADGPMASSSSEAGVWGIESEDIIADKTVRFGVLPNGMRYAIKKNTNPAGEAAIRFGVEVGDREEIDAEIGAAHFIEHMAFNGSTAIPEGQLVPMLERLGLAFGPDTNAETTLDYTMYKLALPNTDRETIDTALKVIREIAGELTITPNAVERERGILLNEAQVREAPARRRGASYFRAAVPGSRIGERIEPNIERIRNISAEQLRAFYQGYYRPERATLVIVGDFDVDVMDKNIRTLFEGWDGDGKARETYRAGLVAKAGPIIASFVDPGIPELIELQRLTPWKQADNSVDELRAQYLRRIASTALSNRINALSRAANSPTLGGQISEQPLYRSAMSFGLTVLAKDGQWRNTLTLAEKELRRAYEYGFTNDEIVEAKANMQTAIANAAAQAAGRNSAALAESLIRASLANRVPTSPAIDLALYRSIEKTLTPEAVSAAFKDAWMGGPSVVHVSTKQPITGGTNEIAEALSSSAALAVTAPVETAPVKFAYDDWGTPGTVVLDETVADLGIRTVKFANGLQLNLKRTNFEPGKIAFSLLIGNGLSAFPADKPGLKEMLPVVMGIDGFAAHDPDQLRRVLAGRAVGIGLGASTSALFAKGVTTPADLNLQLDLLAARLTATAWRAETQAQWAGVAPILVKNIQSTPLLVFINAMNAVLANNDTRLGLPVAANLSSPSLDDLRKVVQPQLIAGGLALGLVGDFDPNSAIAAVASTLGALPARQERAENPNKMTPVRFSAERSIRLLPHAGAKDQGVLALSWATDDSEDLQDDISRDLLAAAIGLRLTETLREELGSTYSPEAFSYSQRAFEGFGHLTALTTVPPEAMDKTAKSIRSIALDFARGNIAADLLERARSPMREGYERANSQNSAWIDTVAMAQSNPQALERWRRRAAILRTVSTDGIEAVARKYLVSDRVMEIRVVPKEN